MSTPFQNHKHKHNNFRFIIFLFKITNTNTEITTTTTTHTHTHTHTKEREHIIEKQEWQQTQTLMKNISLKAQGGRGVGAIGGGGVRP